MIAAAFYIPIHRNSTAVQTYHGVCVTQCQAPGFIPLAGQSPCTTFVVSGGREGPLESGSKEGPNLGSLHGLNGETFSLL